MRLPGWGWMTVLWLGYSMFFLTLASLGRWWGGVIAFFGFIVTYYCWFQHGMGDE